MIKQEGIPSSPTNLFNKDKTRTKTKQIAQIIENLKQCQENKLHKSRNELLKN